MTTINFRSKFIIGEKGGLRRSGGFRERRGAESAPVTPRHPVLTLPSLCGEREMRQVQYHLCRARRFSLGCPVAGSG
jgi:hypothetical protein